MVVKLKGKAFKKALTTKDAHRLAGVPLIQDETVWMTPELAKAHIDQNEGNRDVNWRRVKIIQKDMEEGRWKFHAQGIILDAKGNLLTGQKRLWAIVMSGISQWMRVSKGSPPDTAHLIDRGVSQSSRDLATRATKRKHSPTEGSLVRGIYAFEGVLRPNADKISEYIVKHDDGLGLAMKKTKGIKKTKSVLMTMAAICVLGDPELYGLLEEMANVLEDRLKPSLPEDCWNRGAAFTMAMQKAVKICKSMAT
jgi:hypothetical protein